MWIIPITLLWCLKAFSNTVQCVNWEFEMLREYTGDMHICVFTKFMHFKLFICRAQFKHSGQGFFLACCICTEQNLHFDCLECKHKELVCVCVLDSVWVHETERRKATWELVPFGRSSNALWKTQLCGVISYNPECSGSGEGGKAFSRPSGKYVRKKSW